MSTPIVAPTPSVTTDSHLDKSNGGFASKLLSLVGFGDQTYAKEHPIKNMLVDGVVGMLPGIGGSALMGGNPIMGGAMGILGGAMGNSPIALKMIEDMRKKKEQEDTLKNLTYQNNLAQQQALANNLKSQGINNPLQVNPVAPTQNPM